MSIGFDPGSGGGTGLPAADQSTLDWLNGLTAGQQSPPSPDQGAQLYSDGTDYGNYAPYDNAPPTQGQGYSDYVDQSAQPDFSSGISASDQTQPNFYLDQTPSLPDFSAGLRQQQDNAPVFQSGPNPYVNNTEPTFSSGVDTSGQNPDQGFTQDFNESPVNHYNPDETPWVQDPDGVWRQHGPNDYRKTTAFQYTQNNLGEGLQASGGRPTTNAQGLGTVYWDPNARGDYKPDQNDPLRGWYDGTRQQKWQSEYRTAVASQTVNPTPQGAALVKQLEDELAQWNQWVNDYNAGAAERAGHGYTSQDLADRQIKSQFMTDQMPIDQAATEWNNDAPARYARDVAALGSEYTRQQENYYDNPQYLSPPPDDTQARGYATTAARASGDFDRYVAAVQQNGWDRTVRGLSEVEQNLLYEAAHANTPEQLDQVRQRWIVAHAGSPTSASIPAYLQPDNMGVRANQIGPGLMATATTAMQAGMMPFLLTDKPFELATRIPGLGPLLGGAGKWTFDKVADFFEIPQDQRDPSQLTGPVGGTFALLGGAARNGVINFIGLTLASEQAQRTGQQPSDDEVRRLGEAWTQSNPGLAFVLENGLMLLIMKGGGEALSPLTDRAGAAARSGVAALDTRYGISDRILPPEYTAIDRTGLPQGVPNAPSPNVGGSAVPATPGSAVPVDRGLPVNIREVAADDPRRGPVPVDRGTGAGGPSGDVLVDSPAVPSPVHEPTGGTDQLIGGGTGRVAPEVTPPARPTAPGTLEPPPPVSSIPDTPITPTQAITPEVRTAFNTFMDSPKVRQDPYIPSVEYIARNSGATAPEVNALIQEALADGRLRVINTGRGADIAFVPRKPVSSIPEAPIVAPGASQRVTGAFTKSDVDKLTSVAYYDQPKAIGNAVRAHPDVQERALRSIERINADPKLAAKLRQRDPALAARVLDGAAPDVAPKSAASVPGPYNTQPAPRTVPTAKPPLRQTMYDRIAELPEYEGASAAEIRAAADREIAATYGKNAKYGEFRPDQLVDTPVATPEVAPRTTPTPTRKPLTLVPDDVVVADHPLHQSLIQAENVGTNPAAIQEIRARIFGSDLADQMAIWEARNNGAIRASDFTTKAQAEKFLSVDTAAQRAVVDDYKAALQRGDPAEIKYQRDLASSEGVSDNWLAEIERNAATDRIASDPAARMSQIQDRLNEIDHAPEAVVFNYVNANGQLRAVNPVTGKRIVPPRNVTNNLGKPTGKFGKQPEEIWNIPGSGYDDLAARVPGYNPRHAESMDDFFPRALEMWQERRQLKTELQTLRREAGKTAPNTPVGTLAGTPAREFGGTQYTNLADAPVQGAAAPLKLEMQYGGLPDAEVARIKAQDAGQGNLFDTGAPKKGITRKSVQNDPLLYSIGPAGAKAIARGAVGGLAGYVAPASDEEDRWRHAALGATLGIGIGGINKVIPAIDRAAGSYLYGTADRGFAEAFWKGAAKDLPDVGAGRRKWGGPFAAQKDAQRVIVGDRVSSAIYAALDAELKDAGLITLAPTANKRAAETIIKDLLNNPAAHDLTGVFEGTLGEQLKQFFADYNGPLTNGVKGILSDPVPGGGLLTTDVIAKRFGTLTSGILSDPAAIGVTYGKTWKSDPLLKLNQAIVREFAPVWMILNPRYHINNTMGNLAGEISSVLANPEMVGANAAKGRRAVGAIGSGARYSDYALADLTGNVNQRGSLLSKIPGIGKVIDKAGDAANVVEKNFKDRIFDRNRVGYHSANMRFQFGDEGLGDVAPTLFSDHFGGQTPTLTGLPTSLKESLRGVVDANEAQRIVNSARTAGTITPTQAGAVMKTFRTSLYNAEKFADSEAAWAMRDYRIRSNGDWLLDHVTPLHFWTTHNILATARLAAKNPALIAPVAAGLLYWRSQNEDLPDSLKWTIELPYKKIISVLPQDVQDEIIGAVDNAYGQNADLRLRPWNWINPAIGAAAQTLTPEQSQGHSAAMSMPQLITGWMEKLGYNPSPAWDAMGTALRRIPEVAGFKPIIVAGLNNKDYFNPSIAGQWGSWTRAATAFMANKADASLAPDNAARGVADLLREVPYKFNSAVYGDRYSQYEHEAIAKLVANQERLGTITHDQALNALKNGERDKVFLAARQEFTDQQAGRGGFSWAGLPVSGRNDYQRSVADVNNQYFADGATKADKKQVIANNPWITTDWAKKDSPDKIGHAQELNALWDQYNALPPGKQRSAVYAQIQALDKPATATSPAPSPAPSAKPAPSTPAKPVAGIGKGLVTGLRAADVSNEFLTDADKAKSQALWDEYNRLKDEDQAAKDKTGKNPGTASAFFNAHADEFNQYDVHRTLKPFTTATAASSTTPTGTTAKPAAGIGKGLAAGLRAADVSNEFLTPADKAKSEALWAEYDRLKAIDPKQAAAFFSKNAALFNQYDVHRSLKDYGTTAAKPTTGGGTSTTSRTPSTPTTRTTSSAASSPKASIGTSSAKTPTASPGSKTPTGLPSSSPYTTKSANQSSTANRSPGNPITGIPFSEGISQWTDAQRNARPFISGANAAATSSPARAAQAGSTAPAQLTDKPFSPSAYQSAVKRYTTNPDSNSLNTITGMLKKLAAKGTDITPYAWQVVRDLEKSIVPRIKAYQGPDRTTGDRIRGQMLAAIKQITPDLDGLQLLMEIQGALG